MVAVKVCGITTVEDAEACLAAGVDALGLNFHARSPRCITREEARRIVEAVAGRALVVGVFVDADHDTIVETKQATGIGCVQLHGDEPPELVASLLPHAYKAVRVRDAASVEEARRFPGEHVLLDAYASHAPGGTGERFDWALAVPLARERKVTLAGGLRPENVAEAVGQVNPFCVDVASGVEASPRRKDAARVRAFVAAAKAAARGAA